jgi:hypothetical protein
MLIWREIISSNFQKPFTSLLVQVLNGDVECSSTITGHVVKSRRGLDLINDEIEAQMEVTCPICRSFLISAKKTPFLNDGHK